MLRKACFAAAISSVFVADVAVAQDQGIWAARPHRKVVPEETVPASALPGLAPGLAVQSADGKPVGTVSKVVTAGDGSIKKVIVLSRAGNMMKVSPTAITINGTVVTMQDGQGS